METERGQVADTLREVVTVCGRGSAALIAELWALDQRPELWTLIQARIQGRAPTSGLAYLRTVWQDCQRELGVLEELMSRPASSNRHRCVVPACSCRMSEQERRGLEASEQRWLTADHELPAGPQRYGLIEDGVHVRPHVRARCPVCGPGEGEETRCKR